MDRKGFTLIELLIVVAIIAILAAIAVPNFLEAQTRSKVSRAKADMRSVATGLEAYCVDNQRYPYPLRDDPSRANGISHGYMQYLIELTTPVAYLTSVSMIDPFIPDRTVMKNFGWAMEKDFIGSYQYVSFEGSWGKSLVDGKWLDAPIKGYCISSYGPNRLPDGVEWLPVEKSYSAYNGQYMFRVYDPTNGTVSGGDIGRFGGAIAKWSNAG